MARQSPLAPLARDATTTRPIDIMVVVPPYNAVESIPDIAGAGRVQGRCFLIVGDGSPDGIGGIADRRAPDDDGVPVLRRSEKVGLGQAHAAGIDAAADLDATVFREMGSDFSRDPADLSRLIAAVDAGADFAIGSRYVPGRRTGGWPWHRRAISKGENR